MPKSGLNVALKELDDLFSSEKTRQEEQREQVQQISVSELFPFKNHPFKVLDTFEQLAKEAGAIYKIRRVVLVNLDIFDEYLDTFRM